MRFRYTVSVSAVLVLTFAGQAHPSQDQGSAQIETTQGRTGTATADADRRRADELVQALGEFYPYLLAYGPDDGPTPEENRRTALCAELGSLGQDGVDALGRGLDDFDVLVRQNAALALYFFAAVHKQLDLRAAVPALAVALEDHDAHVRSLSAGTIGWMGPSASAAVPALTKMLERDEPADVKMACYTLGRVGPAASEALPALLDLLSSPNSDIRDRAQETINEIRTRR